MNVVSNPGDPEFPWTSTCDNAYEFMNDGRVSDEATSPFDIVAFPDGVVESDETASATLEARQPHRPAPIEEMDLTNPERKAFKDLPIGVRVAMFAEFQAGKAVEHCIGGANEDEGLWELEMPPTWSPKNIYRMRMNPVVTKQTTYVRGKDGNQHADVVVTYHDGRPVSAEVMPD